MRLHSRADESAGTDHGTRLGPVVNLLTRIITFAVAVYRATARAVVRIARIVGTAFRAIERISRAVAHRMRGAFVVVVAAFVLALSALGNAAEECVNLLLSACREVRRWIIQLGRHVGRAAAVLVRPVQAVLMTFTRCLAAIARFAMSVLRVLADKLLTAWQFVWRWLGPFLIALVRGMLYLIAVLAIVAFRLCAPVARLLRLLVTRVMRLVGTTLRAVGRALERLAAALMWAWASLVALVGRVVKRLAMMAVTLLRVIARVLSPIAVAGRRIAAVITNTIVRVVRNTVAHFARFGRSGSRTLARVVNWLAAIVARPGEPAVHALAVIVSWIAAVAARTRALIRRAYLLVAYRIGIAVLKARRRPDVDDGVGDAVAPVVWTSFTVPFDASVAQNEFLRPHATEVHAIVTLTAHPGVDRIESGELAPETAVVLMLDCSGSMGQPWKKLKQARRAAAAAIDEMRDGTHFAIVGGTDDAQMVYPSSVRMARLTDSTRTAAKDALRNVTPQGGTAMSRWLLLARALLERHGHAIRHGILLTDGRNESDSVAALQRALQTCAGDFQCDCRGVGTDWDVAELRHIARALNGSLDIVPDPAGLAYDFAGMAETAMQKRVGDARLRVWSAPGSAIDFLRQVNPEVRDLTAQGVPIDSQTREFGVGAWGDESRDYHLCMRVRAQPVGTDILAARVRLVVDGRVMAKAIVKAVWTTDPDLSTRIDAAVAHFTGQAELAAAVQDGIAARRAGDLVAAATAFGLAVRLATASGNTETLALLAGVVEIDDASHGLVRVRASIALEDEMRLDTRSERTVSSRA